MNIFKRISDILSANFNEMVEQWEEPEKMLKQAVREMETTIEVSKRNVAKSMASEKLVGKELLDNQRQAKEWQSRAEVAVQAGDDDLARKALIRKQEHDKVTAALSDQYKVSQEASTTLRRQLEAMQAKLADAKRRLGSLAARKRAADVRARIQIGKLDPMLNNDAFAKFDRLREKVEMAEAEADALCELNATQSSQKGEAVVETTETLGVDAELAELKKILT